MSLRETAGYLLAAAVLGAWGALLLNAWWLR